MHLSRRGLIAGAATAAAFSGLARATGAEATAYTNEVHGYGPLVRDPRGIFDLPAGFSYSIVSMAGDRMSDGLITPFKADGMGCFGLDAERVALVRNHEIKDDDLELTAFGPDLRLAANVDPRLIYDRDSEGRPLGGGTTTLIYNLRTRHLERSHLSLAGTAVNCAGGVTPGGSWLSCEETLLTRGPGARKDHGWVFEVPASYAGLVDPTPITGMGRFRHEATATDPRTGIVYLTEDTGDGLFYRYLPNDRERLLAGGRLQALGFKDGPGADTRNWQTRWWSAGDWQETVWIDLEGVDNPHDDLRLRGARAGAAPFARGEGIHFGGGELYFTCTSGGPGRLGQIMRYRPGSSDDEPGQLQLFLEPKSQKAMEMPDNLTITPWGHLVVCEDRSDSKINYLRGVTPQGRVYALGRNPAVAADGETSELAGACFSPDGSTLFVNVYYPGLTLAITGPWASFRV
ncbi:MAG TPA: alkaline phosphatase PhoX [Caulobacteraceae bacterium]|nr:alkaline phosphatase PhoX [Caulobacteraceae bacterium]